MDIFSNMVKRILSVFCWLIAVSFTFSQTEDVQIKVYGFEEGLSHRNVFAIQQDSAGYLWMGTINGLNRFDGIRFRHYHSTSKEYRIPKNYITDVLVTHDNALYLASPNMLVHYDPYSGQSTEYPFNEGQQIRSAEVTPHHLLEDEKQQLWMVNYASHTRSSTVERLDSIGSQPILALAGEYQGRPFVADKKEFYLAAYYNELWKLDHEGRIIQKEKINSRNTITHLQIQKNKLWILTDRGEVFYKIADKIEKHPVSQKLDGNNLNAFWVDQNENIWIGGYANLWFYDAKLEQLTNYDNPIRQLTKNTVHYRQIFQDRQGVIWVASDFGAIKIVRSDRLFQNYLFGGNEHCNNGYCSIRGITADEERDKVYFAYYNSIHTLDLATQEINPLFKNKRFYNLPFGLMYDNNYLYTGNGLKINLAEETIDTLFESTASDKGVVTKDKNGVLWFAYEKQIYCFDENLQAKTTPFQDLLKDRLQSDINYLHHGSYDNYTWLATNAQGLFRWNPSDSTLTHLHTKNSKISADRILAIYEDEAFYLWLATANGLCRYHIPTGEFQTFTTADGLSNNFINGILSEGDSCIWVSTDNGLSRLSKANLQFTNYNKQDGLTDNEFNRISFYQAPDGRMYFGGLNGVNSFYPSASFGQHVKKNQAPILLTSFSRFDGKIDSLITYSNFKEVDSTIYLSPRDHFFTFEFSLADYASHQQNKYSYMLEGFEPEWSNSTENNTARYYNIPAGNYTFKVRAATTEDNWGATILQVPIYVEQAFYKSWEFLLTCILIGLGLIYLLFQLRIYREKQNRIRLEKEVAQRTQELAAAKQQSDELLLNILPQETAEELKQYGRAKAKRFENVTVFFSDFKGFTKIAALLEPEELVAEIDYCFREFDRIIEANGLEKIKTIGDAYMCAGGIPSPTEQHASKVVQAALEIQEFMQQLAQEKKAKNEPYFETRIGIHTGSIVAGIVGIKKFAYDIWGDTVNIAARMEDTGAVGKVNVSSATYELIKSEFSCIHRGKIEVKNKGMIDMYYVEAQNRRVLN